MSRERIRVFYDRFAPDYDEWMRVYESWMRIGDSRRRLTAAAHGRTLEVGVGTGLNLAYYPRDVELTGIDLSPAMLELARQRASGLGLHVDLRVGDGQDLELEAGQFDTLMATLVLSVVADHRRALAEFRRVLKPGGQLLVLDHIRSNIGVVRLIQAAIEPLLNRYAGWHVRRDLPKALASLGFTLESQRRGRLGAVIELVARRDGSV